MSRSSNLVEKIEKCIIKNEDFQTHIDKYVNSYISSEDFLQFIRSNKSGPHSQSSHIKSKGNIQDESILDQSNSSQKNSGRKNFNSIIPAANEGKIVTKLPSSKSSHSHMHSSVSKNLASNNAIKHNSQSQIKEVIQINEKINKQLERLEDDENNSDISERGIVTHHQPSVYCIQTKNNVLLEKNEIFFKHISDKLNDENKQLVKENKKILSELDRLKHTKSTDDETNLLQIERLTEENAHLKSCVQEKEKIIIEKEKGAVELHELRLVKNQVDNLIEQVKKLEQENVDLKVALESHKNMENVDQNASDVLILLRKENETLKYHIENESRERSVQESNHYLSVQKLEIQIKAMQEELEIQRHRLPEYYERIKKLEYESETHKNEKELLISKEKAYIDQIEALQKDIEVITKGLLQNNINNSDVDGSCEIEQFKVENLNEEIDLKKLISSNEGDLKDQLENEKFLCGYFKKKYNEFKNKAALLEHRVKLFQKTHENYEKLYFELRRTKIQVGELKKNNESLKKDLEVHNKRMHDFNNQGNVSDFYQKQLKDFDARLHSKSEELTQITHENSKLQEKLNEECELNIKLKLQKNEIENNYSTLKESIELLEHEKEALRLNLKSCQEHLQTKETQLNRLMHDKKEFQGNADQKVVLLEKEKENLIRDIDEWVLKEKKLNQIINSHIDDKKQLEQKINLLQVQISNDLNKENDNHSQTIIKKKNKIALLKTQIVELTQAKNNLANELKKFENVEMKFQDLKNENDKFKIEHKNLTNQHLEINNRCIVLSTTNEQLAKDVSILKAAVQELEDCKNKDQYKLLEYHKLEIQIKDMNNQISMHIKKIEEINQELQKARSRKRDFKKEVKTLQGEVLSLTSQESVLKDHQKEMEKQFTDAKNLYIEKIQELTKKNAEFQGKLNKKDQKNTENESEMRKLKNEIEVLKKELEVQKNLKKIQENTVHASAQQHKEKSSKPPQKDDENQFFSAFKSNAAYPSSLPSGEKVYPVRLKDSSYLLGQVMVYYSRPVFTDILTEEIAETYKITILKKEGEIHHSKGLKIHAQLVEAKTLESKKFLKYPSGFIITYENNSNNLIENLHISFAGDHTLDCMIRPKAINSVIEPKKFHKQSFLTAFENFPFKILGVQYSYRFTDESGSAHECDGSFLLPVSPINIMIPNLTIQNYEHFKKQWKVLKGVLTLYISELERIQGAKAELLENYSFMLRKKGHLIGAFEIAPSVEAFFKLKLVDAQHGKKSIKIKCLAHISNAKLIQNIINSIIYLLSQI